MVTSLALLFLAIVIISLWTYSFFWYEISGGSDYERLYILSRGKPKRWILYGILSSIATIPILILTFPLGLGARTRKTTIDPSCPKPTVILIHGLYHNASAWLLYRWRLRVAGYRNVLCWSYPSWGASFDVLSTRLISFIKEITFPKVILIGHSLGGLLIRSCLAEPSVANRIAAVITLGSPHQGTKLAVFAPGKLGRSLLFKGKVAKQLNSTPETDPNIPRLALFSPVDNMILPPEALRIKHRNWKEEYTAPLSHATILYHWPTVARIIDFLNEVENTLS